MPSEPVPISVREIRNRGRAPKLEDFPKLFDLISDGTGFNEACKILGLHAATVKNRISGSPELYRDYSMANSCYAEHYANEAVETAKGVLDGTVEAAKARVALPVFQWVAGQADPHTWGKSRVEVTGKNGKDLEINNVIVFKLPDNNR